jgi:hypothetical protein
LVQALTAIFKAAVTLPWYKALLMMALLEGNEARAIFLKTATYLGLRTAPILA